MKIALSSTTTTVVRAYTLEDAPLLARRYGVKQILPDTVKVTFVDGELRSVEVEGPFVKKDGTPGADRSEESYSRWGDRWSLSDPPEWLLPLCDFNYRPED